MVYKARNFHKDTRSHNEVVLLICIHGHDGSVHISPLTSLNLNKNHLVALHTYDIDLEVTHTPIACKYCIPLGDEVLGGILLAHTAQFATT